MWLAPEVNSLKKNDARRMTDFSFYQVIGESHEVNNMPLKKYSTNVPVSRSVNQITSTLVRKGAKQIVTDYNERGQPSGLKWTLNSPYGRLGFMLPVNYDAVFEILTNDGIKKRDAEVRMEQAHRVAWRILKDWIESQIALMESGMVCMEEVFLPYMLAGDRTVYDALVSQQFRALSSIGSSAIALPGPTDNL